MTTLVSIHILFFFGTLHVQLRRLVKGREEMYLQALQRDLLLNALVPLATKIILQCRLGINHRLSIDLMYISTKE